MLIITVNGDCNSLLFRSQGVPSAVASQLYRTVSSFRSRWNLFPSAEIRHGGIWKPLPNLCRLAIPPLQATECLLGSGGTGLLEIGQTRSEKYMSMHYSIIMHECACIFLHKFSHVIWNLFVVARALEAVNIKTSKPLLFSLGRKTFSRQCKIIFSPSCTWSSQHQN